MKLRRTISFLAASLAVTLIVSLIAIQPAFAKGKKAYFPGPCVTHMPDWVEDHCVMNASAWVIVKGKGDFTLYLHTNIEGELSLVHQQALHGPMNFWVHLYELPVGYDADSTTLEWTIMDRKGKLKDFLIMGPYDCDAP